MEEVKNEIQSQLPDAYIEVSDMTGTMDHLEILVVTDFFKNKSRIEQHQTIMDILKDLLKEKVHAVKIKTLTKDRYQK